MTNKQPQSDEQRAKEPDFVPVMLGGVALWVQPEGLREGGESALAPEDHIIDGHLNVPRCFTGDSYAHVYSDGSIRRFGRHIGTRSDLKPRGSV